MICNIQDPITREDYSARPAQRRPQGGQLSEEHRHCRHLLHRPRGRVLHLRRRALRSDAPTRATTTSTASKGNGTAAASKNPNLGYKLRHKEGYFPVPPADQLMNIRNEMMQTMIDCGLDVEAQHHEVATGRPVRNRPAVQRPGEDGRPDVHVQVHHQERRHEARQDRHVHAQAAVRRQRLGHAHAHFAVEGERAAVRRQRLRRPERNGAARHRRLAEARPGDPGLLATPRPTATSGWCRATKRR